MISFKVTNAERDVIQLLVERMEKTWVNAGRAARNFDWLGATMDFTACHANGCPLKLQELLGADDFNFVHDAFGIRRHINRTTGQLEDCFLPRYAAPCRDTVPADPEPLRANIARKRQAEAERKAA